jgi:uncharacterized flavoprotein (TIGR03862 family)
MKQEKVVIIGGGPAGLMSAEIIASAGYKVKLFDAMPSFGRKFLLAGRGGLNLTHSESFEKFIKNYFEAQDWLEPCIKEFDANKLQKWCHELGQETFIGSSGRIFPKTMKTSPLLRGWLKKLDSLGVKFYPNHQWQGFEDKDLIFKNRENNLIREKSDATILALGGASWPHLGSNGKWVEIVSHLGIEVAKLEPSNCGFIANWSEFFSQKFAGTPIKSIAITHKNTTRKGEFVITKNGIEGNAVYALSSYLRDTIKAEGGAILYLDLRPEISLENLAKKLAIYENKSEEKNSTQNSLRGKKSLSNYLQKSGFANYTNSLLRELVGVEKINNADSYQMAKYLKNLPISLTATTNIDRAISSAGGIKKESFDENFMLKKLSGVFVAGEMLNWEAPTGGYLLQGCFSTAIRASNGVLKYLSKKTD